MRIDMARQIPESGKCDVIGRGSGSNGVHIPLIIVIS